MELKQIEAFAAVADYKSFSKAADSLFLTQPTVSSHIGSLEKELGVKLFERSTKNVVLTEDGNKFYYFAKRMVELKFAAIDVMKGTHKQVIYIGASTIPSSYILPEIMTEFRKSNPDVFFDMKYGDSTQIEQKVLDATIEIGVIGKVSTSERISCSAFASDELVLVTPATDSYLALKSKNTPVSNILMEPIILREEGSGSQKAADEYLENQRIDISKLNVVARVNDLEAIKRMVISGMGVSIMSGLAVKNIERTGQVIVYPLETEKKRKFYIAYLKNKIMKPEVMHFIKYIDKYYSA